MVKRGSAASLLKESSANFFLLLEMVRLGRLRQKAKSVSAGANSSVRRIAVGGTAWHPCGMKLTAVFEPAKEGGYTCFVEEVPAAISQGETLTEAKANLLDALKLVLLSQRELAEKDLSPNALREPLEFADA
jgi:predicted RNase H-like HicB family nuclease